MGTLRLGIFGGTFDPPHVGHLMVAQEVVEHLGLDRLFLMVAHAPPLRETPPSTPPALRLEMARAAVAGHPFLEAGDLEIRRGGVSYTVDTLRQLAALYPGAELTFVMGADQALAFPRWREPGEVASRARLVVVPRQGLDPRTLPPVVVPGPLVPEGAGEGGRRVEFLTVPVTRVDVSASLVRERVRLGRSIRYLVPPGVEALIYRHDLYREPPPSRGEGRWRFPSGVSGES